MVYKHLVLGCDDDVCMYAGQHICRSDCSYALCLYVCSIMMDGCVQDQILHLGQLGLFAKCCTAKIYPITSVAIDHDLTKYVH